MFSACSVFLPLKIIDGFTYRYMCVCDGKPAIIYEREINVS